MIDDDSIVFLVDDDPSVRKSLGRLILSAGYRVEVFASAQEFLDREACEGPGCLILDVQMPGINGLDLQQSVGVVYGDALPIVFISGHGDIPTSVCAMKAGAVDFLPKPFPAEVLFNAVEEALAKSRHELTDRTRLMEIRKRLALLTPREYEVLSFVVSGRPNKQIAAELGVTEKTVKVHRGRVFQKMGVQSLAELVRVTEKVGISSRALSES